MPKRLFPRLATEDGLEVLSTLSSAEPLTGVVQPTPRKYFAEQALVEFKRNLDAAGLLDVNGTVKR